MTYFLINQNHGPNEATDTEVSTLEEAGREMLGYDQQGCGVEQRGEDFIPWQRPHRGPVKYLTNLAGFSEAEAWENVAHSQHFTYECVTAEQYQQMMNEIAAND